MGIILDVAMLYYHYSITIKKSITMSSYITTQLERVKETNQYGRSIKITADGGAKETNFIAIDDTIYNAIQGILTYEPDHTKEDGTMSPYDLFMWLQTWSIDTMRDWLQRHDSNGDYDDDIENGFVLTREYAINTIFRFLIIDNQ